MVDSYFAIRPEVASIDDLMRFSDEQRQISARVQDGFMPWIKRMSDRTLGDTPLDEPTLRAIREEAEALLSAIDEASLLYAESMKGAIGITALNILSPRLPGGVGDEDRLFYAGLALDALNNETFTIIHTLEEVEGHDAQVRELARRALVNLAARERIAEKEERRARELFENAAESGALRRMMEEETGTTLEDAEYDEWLSQALQSTADEWPPRVRSYSGTGTFSWM